MVKQHVSTACMGVERKQEKPKIKKTVRRQHN